MTEFKNRLMYMLTAATKVKVGTWVRLVLMIVSFLNLGLAAMGKAPVSVGSENIYTIVSLAAAFVVGALNYWKNNSFTDAAIKADEYLHSQGFADEDPGLEPTERLDIKDAIEFVKAFRPEDKADSAKLDKVIDALYKVDVWVDNNPDKVDAIEKKLNENIKDFIEKAKAKINK